MWRQKMTMAETDPSAGPTTLRVEHPQAMHELGVRLGNRLRAGDLVVLTGPLGAGKTTLSRGIGEGLGVRGPVTSPTFVLARTHPSTVGGPPLVHVDAYRLTDASELDDLDIDFDASVVLMEWGAGLVQPSESWIEVTIERPTGAALAAPPPGGGDSSIAQSGSDALFEDEIVEPRIVTIAGYGRRWVEGVL